MTDMRSSDEGTIFEVNPVTGDRTIISSGFAGNTVGTGPGLFFATRLAPGPGWLNIYAEHFSGACELYPVS